MYSCGKLEVTRIPRWVFFLAQGLREFMALHKIRWRPARPEPYLTARYFIFALLVIGFCGSFSSATHACDRLSAGQTFRIRLLQPISSYSSKPGTVVRGFLIESPQCDGLLAFQTGALVEGRILSVHKVGMGFRHEIATIDIAFSRILQNGESLEMNARVLGVDNAREKVKNGVIQGIRGTNTPQDRLSSRVPYLAMWYPGTYWVLPAYRALFPIFPEPEIYFPSGTDLLLGLVSPMSLPAGERVTSRNQEFDPSKSKALDEVVLSLPPRTSTPKGQDADVVNLAFIGSQKQIESAFQAAGWMSTDAPSRRATLRGLNALLLLRGYPHGPMSEQLLNARPYDFSWQKGLDSYAKRDHLRIWSNPDTWLGQPVWFSASTQDVGVRILIRKKEITHRVDADIDGERDKIVRDLTLAGCVEAVHNTSRPEMPLSLKNATGDKLSTDGAVAVIQLKDCGAPVFVDTVEDDSSGTLLTRPPSKVARYFRTQVLSFRDMWRENAVYDAVDLSRKAVRSIRRKEQSKQLASAASPQSALKLPGAQVASNLISK
jgi:hypothetical protein